MRQIQQVEAPVQQIVLEKNQRKYQSTIKKTQQYLRSKLFPFLSSGAACHVPTEAIGYLSGLLELVAAMVVAWCVFAVVLLLSA